MTGSVVRFPSPPGTASSPSETPGREEEAHCVHWPCRSSVGPSGRKDGGLIGEEVMGVLRLRVLDKKAGVGGEGKTRRVSLRLDKGITAFPVAMDAVEAA